MGGLDGVAMGGLDGVAVGGLDGATVVGLDGALLPPDGVGGRAPPDEDCPPPVFALQLIPRTSPAEATIEPEQAAPLPIALDNRTTFTVHWNGPNVGT